MDSQKVFVIGLGRTGTTSMTEALGHLGYTIIHTPDVWHQLKYGDYNLDLLNHPQVDGIGDVAAAIFFKQLDREWPGSKFILTLRELGGWLRSQEYHVKASHVEERTGAARENMVFTRAAAYGSVEYERWRFIDVYRDHLRSVRDHFSGRDDLLQIKLGWEGQKKWSLLCEFLGKASPRAEFPMSNSTDWSARNEKDPFEFTNDTDVGGIPEILEPVCFGRRSRGVMIGVKNGNRSCRLLQEYPETRLVCVDPWEYIEDYVQRFDRGMKRGDFRKAYRTFKSRIEKLGAERQVDIRRMTSVEAGREWDGRKFDFAFIDGQHSASAVREDIQMWWPKIKAGGMIVGHDWTLDSVRSGVQSCFNHVQSGIGKYWWRRVSR